MAPEVRALIAEGRQALADCRFPSCRCEYSTGCAAITAAFDRDDFDGVKRRTLRVVEEGEPALARFAQETQAARRALVAAARYDIHRPWCPRELRQRAGVDGPAAMYATTVLVNDGTAWLDSHLRLCFYPKEWDE